MGITDNVNQVVVIAPCLQSKSDRKRIFGKMKVLKKIKKRMGLASRSSSNGHGTNNLPPLLFHNVCGENIRISRDGTVARRAESFCKGIAFSSRPVKVNEKICIKFLEISNNWSGVIRFGFSYNDPSTLRDGLPKYACPDLTNKPGYWAKALPERFCNQGTVLFYYVSAAGDVHFGINNEEKGIFFSGVETRGPLWALIDVYGNSTAIEFVDIRHQLNNARSRSTSTASTEEPDIERIICSTQNMNLHHHSVNQQREATVTIVNGQQQIQQPSDCVTTVELGGQLHLRYQPIGSRFVPMPLHRTRGRNVRITSITRSEAARVENEFCQGYVFTARPLTLNQPILIQILSSAPQFQGSLGLGLTSCDPATLSPADLPDDSSFLLDRPEYWVISRDFARSLNIGDEVTFAVSERGEVAVRRNGASEAAVVMHVDQTLKLWAVFDVYGGTKKIRVLTQQLSSQQQITSTILTRPISGAMINRVVTTPNSESMNSVNEQIILRRTNTTSQQVVVTQQQQPSLQGQQRLTFSSADIQVQPSPNGGAVLSVILPPSHANIIQSPIPAALSGFQQYTAQLPAHVSNIHQYQQCSNGNSLTNEACYNTSSSAVGLLAIGNVNSSNSNVAPLIVSGSSTGTTSGAIISSSCSNNTYIEPIAAHPPIAQQPTTSCHADININTNTADSMCLSQQPYSKPPRLTTAQSWVEQNAAPTTITNGNGGQYSAGAECTICYENSIDAVLYMCGHMCMCYECALQQWRGKGGGHCPLCRAIIRDVIRTYKS